MKCPYCEKAFDFTEKPEYASRAFRSHVMSCTKARDVKLNVKATAAIVAERASEVGGELIFTPQEKK